MGGAGVGRGYLNRAELTAERFIPDPFSESGGERLYRTGDLARYLPDGNLEYLGRKDQQVKVRGYRIELGEIEAVLGGHEWVSQAVVVVREQEQGKQLVAYVVGKAGVVVEGSELRKYLGARLPEYMVPAFVVVLEAVAIDDQWEGGSEAVTGAGAAGGRRGLCRGANGGGGEVS